MKKIILSVISILAISCGKSGGDNIPYTVRFIEEDFVSVVEDFESMYGVQINYPVVYVDSIPSPAGAIGICHKQNNVPVRVEILKSWVQNRKPNQIDAAMWLVLWHELGHCSLNLDHSLDSGDIMYKSVVRNLRLLYDESLTKDSLVEKLNTRIQRGPVPVNFFNSED